MQCKKIWIVILIVFDFFLEFYHGTVLFYKDTDISIWALWIKTRSGQTNSHLAAIHNDML